MNQIKGVQQFPMSSSSC